MRMDQHAWSVWSPHVSTCGDVALSHEAWCHGDVIESRDRLEPSSSLGNTCSWLVITGAYLILSEVVDKERKKRSWHGWCQRQCVNQQIVQVQIKKKTSKMSNYTGIRPEQFWSLYYDTGGLYILNGRTVKHMSLKQACCRVVWCALQRHGTETQEILKECCMCMDQHAWLVWWLVW